MKKILRLLIVLLSSISLIHEVNALETSFTERFAGFAIDTNNNINNIGILGENILGSGAGNTYFKIASQIVNTSSPYVDDKILYCADAKKGSPAFDGVVDSVPFSQCYIRKGTGSNDKSIAFIYENGYGNYKTNYSATKYLTGDWKQDYYITQVAMWYFTNPDDWMNSFDFEKGTYNGQTSEVITKITKLITDAKTASDGASLKIEASNNKLNLTSDGNYYITDPIKLSGKYTNSQITTSVSGTNGAFVTTDKDATSGNTIFNNNSTVYIKIPISNITAGTEITLNILATTSIEESEAIECKHHRVEEYQPIIIFYPYNTTLTDSASFSRDYFSVKVSKRRLDKTEELEGATLTITDYNGTTMDTWVSGTTAKTIELLPGTYILEELEAPERYELSDEIIEFTINNEGKVLIDGKEIEDNTIIFENIPEPEQVQTGIILIYVAVTICLISLGAITYFIIKRKQKQY